MRTLDIAEAQDSSLPTTSLGIATRALGPLRAWIRRSDPRLIARELSALVDATHRRFEDALEPPVLSGTDVVPAAAQIAVDRRLSDDVGGCAGAGSERSRGLADSTARKFSERLLCKLLPVCTLDASVALTRGTHDLPT